MNENGEQIGKVPNKIPMKKVMPKQINNNLPGYEDVKPGE